MANLFSNPDVVLWKTLIVGKGLLCLCVFKKKLFDRLPWFSAYILTTTAKSLLLFSLASWSSYGVYYYVFYATSYLEAVLVLFALTECALQVLPGFDLPKKSKAVILFVGAVAIVVGFAAVWPLRFLENRIEIACYFAIAIVSVGIAIYARYLGLHWSRLIARMTSILGLLYFADGTAYLVQAHYPSAIDEYVRRISESVNMLAVIAWTVVILSPWGEYDPTDEELAQAKRIVDDVEDNLRHAAARGTE